MTLELRSIEGSLQSDDTPIVGANMANDEDLQLFLQGGQPWNANMNAWDTGRDLPASGGHQRDLSGTRIGVLLVQRAERERGRSVEQATEYPAADLSFANLARTDFRNPYASFNLRKANFLNADLREANLEAADLTGAEFTYANLEHAVLRGAKVDQAEFALANLTGTDLTATRPWRAHLFRHMDPAKDPGTPARTVIRRVADLIDVCLDLPERRGAASDFELYYRGEAKHWKLRPSAMRRSQLRESEGQMLLDMMTRRPEDFSGMVSALDQWVLAQHHGLKTRLLDITKNPLVALFYACEGDLIDDEGRLHIFVVPHGLVKPYNSDSVSVIANFAKLTRAEQSLLLGKRRGCDWRRLQYAQVMNRLYHLIGTEKPHFQRRIDLRDLFRVFIVEPQQSVERLRAQSGAFLISAFHERFERDQIVGWNESIPSYHHYTLIIPPGCKSRILKELELLHVTRETLFPGLDETAKAVTSRHTMASPGRDNDAATGTNKTWRETMRSIENGRRALPPEYREPF